VETKTIGKILVAFLAGVFLALAGGILLSRQPAIGDPVRPVQASSKAPQTTPPHAVAPEPTVELDTKAESRDEVPSQAPPKLQAPVAVANRKPSPRPVTAGRPQAQVQEARLSPPSVAPEPKGNGRDPLPTASPSLPQATSEGGITPSTPNSTLSARPVAAEPPQDAPASQQPHIITLPAGTTLTVRLRETLDSDRANSGDPFQATLDAPVVAGGFIIAERQSKVLGHVVQSTRSGRVKGLANLSLAISQINTTDGQLVAVQTDSYEKWGNSSVKGDTAKVAGGAALGAIIGAIAGGGKGAAIGAGAGGAAGTGVALGTRGSSVSVPSESIITFRLARPVTITEKFN